MDLSLYVIVLVITQCPCWNLLQMLNHKKKRKILTCLHCCHVTQVLFVLVLRYPSWDSCCHPNRDEYTFCFCCSKLQRLYLKNATETSPSTNQCPSSSGESTGSAANRFLSAAAFYRSKKQSLKEQLTVWSVDYWRYSREWLLNSDWFSVQCAQQTKLHTLPLYGAGAGNLIHGDLNASAWWENTNFGVRWWLKLL